MKKPATSFDLSPAEIKNKDFKKIMLGYSPEEVVGFLDKVAKLWEKIQKREKDLVSVIDTLDKEIQDWKNKESQLELIKEKAHQEAQGIIQKSKEEAKKILADAELMAEDIRSNTEKWLATILEEVESVEKRRANFVTAFRAALDSHYEILQKEQQPQQPLALKLHEFLKTGEKVPSNSLLS